jgi:hypothetical protein
VVEPTVQFVDAVMIIAHWHNVQIIDQGGMLLSEHVRALTAKSEVLAKRFPQMMATLSLVRAQTPISPKPVREELVTMMKDTYHIEAQTAVVLEATGIFASVLRTTLRTTMLISGNRKLKIVGSLAEAMPLILPIARTGDGAAVSRADIESAVSKVRAIYEQHLSRAGEARVR